MLTVPLEAAPRSAAVRRQFLKLSGYPHGRPGYVVDHIIPLACGGLDAVSNMQWQTAAEAKAKDKVERVGCPTVSRRARSRRPSTAPR